MSISAGYTVEEIRDLVLGYQLQPHGQKRAWLAAQGVGPGRMRRWRAAVFEGEMDRGLIPREGSPMTVSPDERTAMARQRAKDQAVHEAEIARLAARVRELELTNEALGKAIGLLHRMNEQEPGAALGPSDRPGSSTPTTGSWQS